MPAGDRRSLVLVITLAAAAPTALADNPFPPHHVERTKILLTGEDAPGIPGCTVASFLAPQIDGAGKVLIDGSISGPGVTGANNGAIWYGEADGMTLVAREGAAAPQISGAYLSEPWGVYLSESGVIALSCYLTGPSINPGVNARATFAGTAATGLTKIIQASDPAPFTEPGTVFASSFTFGVRVSDNGSVLLVYDLAGPSVTSTNDQAMYVGYPANPQLMWRKGMQAPDCEPGVVFAGADGVVFCDVQRVLIRGFLTGEDVTPGMNVGYWAGGTEGLTLIKRTGYPALKLPLGTTPFTTAFGGINTFGDVAVWASLVGEGVSSDNDEGIWAGTAPGLALVVRKGDAAPDAAPGTVVVNASASGAKPINARGELALEYWLAGPDVDPTNNRAVYFGSSDAMHLVLREGDALTQLSASTYAALGSSKYALNDVGDLAMSSQLSGPDVAADNNKLVLARRRGGWWAPLLRTGDVVDGQTVIADSLIEFTPITDSTGGSDAIAQRINDAGQLAAMARFSNGTQGVYVIRGSAAIDVDLDGDLDLEDLSGLAGCLAGPNAAVGFPCSQYDVNSDQAVDLRDAQLMQSMFSGAM